jgi:choline-sulfatase
MYMLRRGPWKFIHTPADPDQLFNLVDDPEEVNNLAAAHPIAKKFRSEVEAKFDIPRIHDEVMRSQQARAAISLGISSHSARRRSSTHATT